MVKKPEPRREELRSNLATKEVYYFVNEDTGIEVKCKEVFKKKKEIRHFPFNRDGKPKYKSVKFFKFIGFKDNVSLPVGISKSSIFGLGFTKYLAPLMDALLDKYKVIEVHVLKSGTTSLDDETLTLTESVLKNLHPLFKHINDVQRQDRLDLATEQLTKLFPDKFTAPKKKYVKNTIHTILESWSQDINDFSDSDKAAIKDLFDKLVMTGNFLSTDTLLATKDSLDKQYIEDVIEAFTELMNQKHETSTLEKKWHTFLGKHNWVFSYVFSFPIMFLQDEAYVGGKNLSNRNGKVTDFLVKNALTHNVAFIEIKTHRTALVGSKIAYRGDDVYPMSKDITGGITQVLDQRDNFQKEFYAHKAKSDEEFETANSKCVVLMGMISTLKPKELKSFELFRNNSKDVELVTFDELLARFEKIYDLINKGT
ncbi:MAG: DUF4263 domain-containing protein [Nitrospinae bacterium]|nr:DUF4263 domain-containing protein [Nitrospinota bacterium]